MDIETQAVLRAQAGDTDAFRTIVDQHGAVLYRAAVMLTRNPATAEDAVQETFLKAWRAIGSFKAGTRLRAWLVTILMNHLRGNMRRRVLQVVRLQSEELRLTTHGTPESRYLKSESMSELFALLDCLRNDEKTVIVMHYYMEMSLAEISEATGWPGGTVRSRLSRALGRLRDRLTAGSDVTFERTERSVGSDQL